MTSRRRMWDDVLPRWRASNDALHTHGATPSQRAVLQAVQSLLAAHQLTEDDLYLTQIARDAGIWDGAGPCPRSATAAAGRHLQALHDIGAIVYTASGGRRPGRVALPEPNRAHDTRGSDDPNRAPQTPEPRASDRSTARGDRPNRAPGTRATEGFPEDPSEGKPEGLARPHTREAGHQPPPTGALTAPPDDHDEDDTDPGWVGPDTIWNRLAQECWKRTDVDHFDTTGRLVDLYRTHLREGPAHDALDLIRTKNPRNLDRLHAIVTKTADDWGCPIPELQET